jgi:monovalent cation:H+ antiporter-2, CPA2 family
MHNIELILTAAGGLTAALVLGYITHRIGLSPIVGYLLAGVAVGPYTPGFTADRELAEQLAEVGVILLLFGVGLQFHIKELLAVRNVALPGAIVQSTVATALGAITAHALGWSWASGIVFGLALSVASTVVLIRVLSDYNDLHTPVGHISVGWLVVEDIFTVLVLVLMPALFGGDGGEAGVETGPSTVLWNLLVALGKIAVLVLLTVVAGGRLIPRLLERVALTRSRELFNLTVLVIALGIAAVSAILFNVSMALGAFLAGLVVGRSEFSVRAAGEAVPLRDAFGVLFFVSVGMLFDPRAIIDAPALIAAALGIVLIGKPLAALAIVLALRYPLAVAMAVAVALAQIGEFSFILATMARDLGVLDQNGTNAIVATAMLSISLNPLLYRFVDPTGMRPGRRGAAGAEAPSVELHPDARYRAIVVGYGPTGQSLTRLLLQNGIDPTIVDLNLEVVRQLRDAGLDAVYGDSTRRDTLVQAKTGTAGYLILASAAMQGSEEIIRVARELNPRVRILARASYLRELPALRRAGADVAFSGEGEVALAFTEEILRELGASAEQIDRERARVRESIVVEPRP